MIYKRGDFIIIRPVGGVEEMRTTGGDLWVEDTLRYQRTGQPLEVLSFRARHSGVGVVTIKDIHHWEYYVSDIEMYTPSLENE